MTVTAFTDTSIWTQIVASRKTTTDNRVAEILEAAALVCDVRPSVISGNVGDFSIKWLTKTRYELCVYVRAGGGWTLTVRYNRYGHAATMISVPELFNIRDSINSRVDGSPSS